MRIIMKKLTINNIAASCKGTIYNCSEENKKNTEVTDVVIDSRKVTQGCLFIAIKGARVDGHDFIESVIKEAGALCAISEKKLDTDVPYILVESTLQAIMDIAAYYRDVLGTKIVGITGSVGKTSTKEMIASVLEEKYNVLKTEGNFNNEIGLPLTIFRLREEHEIAIIEMGISHFGDMTTLAKITRPDMCVITNIGVCHLENLIDRDGVLKAKTEVFDYLPENGRIILNGDDDKLITVKEHNGIKPVFYGINGDFDVSGTAITALGLKGSFFTMKYDDKSTDVYIKVPGAHMVHNALAAAAVGREFDMTSDEIKHGIERVRAVNGRINVIETDRYTIIDDCYNASPISVKAAIDVLTYAKGRKVAILGDMFELGDNEVQLHESIGEYISHKNIDLIICIGNLSKNTCESAVKCGVPVQNVVHFQDIDSFFEEGKSYIKRGDNILVKASHGMNFSTIVDYFKSKS